MCIVYVYLSSIASIMKQSHHVYSVSDRLSLAVNPVYLRKSREKNCEKKKGFKSLFFNLDRKSYDSRKRDECNLHAEIPRT